MFPTTETAKKNPLFFDNDKGSSKGGGGQFPLNSYTLYYKISDLQLINLDFECKKRSSTVVIKKVSFM